MKIAICDDEKNILEDIGRMVKSHSADCHVDSYSSGALLLASDKIYDIYFLDIQMPGVSGIETAKRIRAKESVDLHSESIIIFITSFTDFWEDAFDIKAYHYLVKPLDKRKFNTVFARAVADCRSRKENEGKYILIKSNDSRHKVLLKDIYYVESQNKKVIVYSENGTIDHYGKMRGLEDSLGVSFFRCHRCYLVNMEHIIKYNATTIWLRNGSIIAIAQKKYGEFVKTYMKFAKSGGLIHD